MPNTNEVMNLEISSDIINNLKEMLVSVAGLIIMIHSFTLIYTGLGSILMLGYKSPSKMVNLFIVSTIGRLITFALGFIMFKKPKRIYTLLSVKR